jgi:hypothetical protein
MNRKLCEEKKDMYEIWFARAEGDIFRCRLLKGCLHMEEKISDDDSSDYANPDEDDFDSILRESISIKNFNESKLEGNPFNTIDNKKIKKSGNNIINNNDIKNLEKKNL